MTANNSQPIRLADEILEMATNSLTDIANRVSALADMLEDFADPNREQAPFHLLALSHAFEGESEEIVACVRLLKGEENS